LQVVVERAVQRAQQWHLLARRAVSPAVAAVVVVRHLIPAQQAQAA
jgi:hypothetical protein